MMDGTAWTCSPSYGKVFRAEVLVSAGMADLRRRKKSACLHHLLSVPIRFIFQLSDELTPWCVCNRLGQPVVAKYILHCQVFDADGVIASRQLSRQLVKRVLALVYNVFITLSGCGNPLALAGGRSTPLIRSHQPCDLMYFWIVAVETSPMLQAKYPSDQKICFSQKWVDK